MKTLLASCLLSLTAVAQTYTVSNFGAACSGAIHGQVVQAPAGTGLRVGATGTRPNAHAVLVVGHQAPSPIQLPGSQCQLLVQPRFTMLGMTDANGVVRFSLRLPPIVPITVDFQVVVIGLSPTQGRVAVSTDGLRLVGV